MKPSVFTQPGSFATGPNRPGVRLCPFCPENDRTAHPVLAMRLRIRALLKATAGKPSPKGGGAPKSANCTGRTSGCGARHANECCHSLALRARAPSGAPPRTRFGELTPQLSSSRASWAASLSESTCSLERRLGVIGCHPHLPLSQSSELLAGQSLLPAGRCPEPPGSGVTSPARGHRTRFRHSAVTGDALRKSKLARK
jgi:hypothetical protein